jgi:hypothetical protein
MARACFIFNQWLAVITGASHLHGDITDVAAATVLSLFELDSSLSFLVL